MSKLDAQRALKEAKYAREMAAAEARRQAAGKPAAVPVAPPAPTDAGASAPAKAKAKSRWMPRPGAPCQVRLRSGYYAG